MTFERIIAAFFLIIFIIVAYDITKNKRWPSYKKKKSPVTEIKNVYGVWKK